MRLPADDEIRILRLYEEDIIRSFIDNTDLLVIFDGIIPYTIEELKVRYGIDAFGLSIELWKELINGPTKAILFPRILQFLYKAPTETASLVHEELVQLTRIPRRGHFLSLIKYADELFNVIDQDKVSESLSKILGYAKLLKLMSAYAEQDTVFWKKVLLRKVLLFNRGLQSDFLNAVTLCGEEASVVVEKVYPGFRRHYELLTYERSAGIQREVVHVCGPAVPVAHVIQALFASSDEFKFNIRLEKFSRFCRKRPVGTTFDTADEIPLRDYQLELAEAACLGKNTIICAPTGSGKTVVAAYVIRKHLSASKNRCKEEGDSAKKVCFCVTNTTFLEQQAALFEKYLFDRWRVAVLSGTVKLDLPVRVIIQTADVVVVTPQMIVNLLISNSSGILEIFSLSTFSLIIFDESHHADLEHPYNVILEHYHAMKASGYTSLPQIIGLTASIGVGGAKTFEACIEYLVTICANLDCNVLSRVRRHKSELQFYSSSMSSEVILVPAAYKSEQFYRKVIGLMDMFESRILSMDSDEITCAIQKVGFPPRQKDLQAYELWFSILKGREVPETVRNSDNLLVAMECLEYIEIFYKTLLLCAHFPCHIAQNYLVDHLNKRRWTSSEMSLQFINGSGILDLDVSTSKNELYEALRRLMKEEFSNNSDSRALVFARTREIAAQLCEAFNAMESLLMLGVKSNILVGVNSSKLDGGQSANEQRDTLLEFVDGRLKILFATSVAEEGIDIQKCNLVVSYNYATNEIAYVQRRGRGRAEGSRCIVITNNEILKEKEETNALREVLMNEALNYIDCQPTEWFEQKVSEKIADQMERREREKLKKAERLNAQNGRKFILFCRKCGNPICNSDQIVTDIQKSQYFVIKADFWCAATCTEYTAERKLMEQRFESAGLGSHYCGKCRHQWGRVVFTQNVLLPILACEAFSLDPVFDNKDNSSNENFIVMKRRTFRKWKKVLEVCFTPRVMTTHDLAVMIDAQQKPAFTTL